jgi:hypothetical protein
MQLQQLMQPVAASGERDYRLRDTRQADNQVQTTRKLIDGTLLVIAALRC